MVELPLNILALHGVAIALVQNYARRYTSLLGASLLYFASLTFVRAEGTTIVNRKPSSRSICKVQWGKG